MDTWQRYQRDFANYLKLEKGLAANSIEAYLRDVSHLAEFMSGMNVEPEDVTVDLLRQLLNVLNDIELSPLTQRRMISGWRTFYKMLVVEEAVKSSPAELLDLPKSARHLPDVLTDEEITKIQSTFDLSQPDQYRNNVIVEVLYGCGLRVSELVNQIGRAHV